MPAFLQDLLDKKIAVFEKINLNEKTNTASEIFEPNYDIIRQPLIEKIYMNSSRVKKD